MIFRLTVFALLLNCLVGQDLVKSQSQEQCLITPSCHNGLAFSCGFRSDTACTDDVQLGDVCRRYADCVIDEDGVCGMTLESQVAVERCSLLLSTCAISMPEMSCENWGISVDFTQDLLPDCCEKWFDGCNECRITGNHVSCTRKYCPWGLDGEPRCVEFETDRLGAELRKDESDYWYSRFEGLTLDNDCRKDSDCVVSGCSSEVCAAEAGYTTCEQLAFSPQGTCGCKDSECIWLNEECEGDCPPESDWTTIEADPSACSVILFLCVEGMVPWFDEDCGCGCRPTAVGECTGCAFSRAPVRDCPANGYSEGPSGQCIYDEYENCVERWDRCPCNGFVGWVCPDDRVCVDIPDDNCDPDHGGADCMGSCETVGSSCDDCVLSRAPIFLCPSGHTEGPSGECVYNEDGNCAERWDRCPCGGIAGWQCPDGQACIDDPDSCDPDEGGRDCSGTCQQDNCVLLEAEDLLNLNGWAVFHGDVLHAGEGIESSGQGPHTLDFSFTGTSFLMFHGVGPNRGTISISIDGATPVFVDTTRDDFDFQIRADIAQNLAPGLVHSVHLECVETICAIDYFDSCTDPGCPKTDDPLSLIGVSCTNIGETCYYGEETCCGETHPSFFCSCSEFEGVATFACGYTDACFGGCGGGPDLIVQEVSRASPYYKIQFCNIGSGTGPDITLLLTDTATGNSFQTNSIYPFPIPAPGDCRWTGGITCGLIGDTNCDANICVEAFVDDQLEVAEIDETNNKFNVCFGCPKTDDPLSLIGATCTNIGETCYYGDETCCGETHPSLFCSCSEFEGVATFACGYTDACFGGCDGLPCDNCGRSLAPIRLCPNEINWEGPSGQCVYDENEICVERWDRCPCGGIGGWQCPDDQVCVDDRDGCDPEMGGRDCSGTCFEQEEHQCCDPQLEPGTNGRAFCTDGHACCTSGEWECSIGDGTFTCGETHELVCDTDDDTVCCDTSDFTGCTKTPPSYWIGLDNYYDGALCYHDGEWCCNEDGCPDPHSHGAGTICRGVCDDLADIDFGQCEAIIGFAVVSGECVAVSGCSKGEFELFATLDECVSACMDDCVLLEAENLLNLNGWAVFHGEVLHAGEGIESNGQGTQILDFSFTGTSLMMFHGVGPNRGIISVSIDGATPVFVNTTRNDFDFQIRADIAQTLSPGLHSVHLECVETICAIDYFDSCTDPDCPVSDEPLSDVSGAACSNIGLTCHFGEEHCCGETHPEFFCSCVGDEKEGSGTYACGYADMCLGGCPAVCPPEDGWTVVSDDPETCAAIRFTCEESMYPWFDEECGCGCKPMVGELCDDCFRSLAPIRICPNGFDYEGPGQCFYDENGVCVQTWNKCPCAGFPGWTCPDGQVCIDDPDNCDPWRGGSDCSGTCGEDPCNLVDCHPDSICVSDDGEARCVEVCGDKVCDPGEECKYFEERAYCVASCDAGFCDPYDCHEVQVMCITAPCWSLPVCRCGMRCQRNFDPVCDMYGRQYQNQCEFDLAACERRPEVLEQVGCPNGREETK